MNYDDSVIKEPAEDKSSDGTTDSSAENMCDGDVAMLIADVRSGGIEGEESFEKLVALYQPLIKSVSSSFSNSAEIIGNANCYNDFCQELTMALYRAAQRFDISQSKVTFGKYAKVCLTNKAISVLRKQKSGANREKKMKKRMEERLKHENRESNPFSGLLDNEKNVILNEIGAVLSPFELKVFEKYLDGMKAGEISAELSKVDGIKCSCTEKSVNNAIYRVKVKVKKAYSKKFFNG